MQTALLTDLYQLNMLAAYLDHGLTETAVFELFVRKLPAKPRLPDGGRPGAGARLSRKSGLLGRGHRPLARDQAHFRERLLEYLGDASLHRRVDALPEGTVFFPDEPILRVIAPLPQAQLVETRLINLVHFETVIASKAARMVLAANGKPLVDFGLRRAHGAEAGMLAARASYLAGFAGTATLAAGLEFGIPVKGTMAHSFIQAHDDEELAFEHFARSRPRDLVLLIDTYDTERAAERSSLWRIGSRPRGSSFPGCGSTAVISASMPDGCAASSTRGDCARARSSPAAVSTKTNLRSLRDAPINSFGVGTSLTTSSDAPALDCAYKLQEYAGKPRRKRSAGKATWPGRKQVWRSHWSDGEFVRDLISLEGEADEGEALLRPAMRAGRRITAAPSLSGIQAHARDQLACLPAPLKHLDRFSYPVEISASLRRLADELDRAEQTNAPTNSKPLMA